MTITVYTKPACVQCNATYKALDKQGIAYEIVDISLDAEARDYVMALGYLQAGDLARADSAIAEARDYVMAMGYLQAPIVVAGDEHWSGFRPDRIKALGGAGVLTA